jgi:hypothetical protein
MNAGDPVGAARWLSHPNVNAKLTSHYIDALADTARLLHLNANDFGYSERELKAAFHEANVDIDAMWRRRGPQKNGLSLGKIAGVLAYRLSRYKIVWLSDTAAEQKNAFLLQDLSALTFVCEDVLRRKPTTKSLCELAYQIARRHANQETLALCFDLYSDLFEPIHPSL